MLPPRRIELRGHLKLPPRRIELRGRNYYKTECKGTIYLNKFKIIIQFTHYQIIINNSKPINQISTFHSNSGPAVNWYIGTSPHLHINQHISTSKNQHITSSHPSSLDLCLKHHAFRYRLEGCVIYSNP